MFIPRILWLAIAISTWTLAIIVAEKNGKCDDSRQSEKRKSQPLIRELVARLNNRNRPPTVFAGRPQAAVFPDKYDWAAQATVIDAWKALDQRAGEALTELAARFDDTEYCITCGGFDGKWSNRTIGDICQLIVTSNVIPCVLTSDHPPIPCKDDKALLRKWSTDRKGMPLKAMQLETMASAMKFYEAHPLEEDGNRESGDKDYVLRRLDKILERIKTTGRRKRSALFAPDWYHFASRPREK